MSIQRELVKVVHRTPRAEFLRIARRLSSDFGDSANDMDLCTATQVVDTPVLCGLEENLEQRFSIDLF